MEDGRRWWLWRRIVAVSWTISTIARITAGAMAATVIATRNAARAVCRIPVAVSVTRPRVVVRARVVCDRLGKLVAVVRILLAQRVVFALQPTAIGRCIDDRLLMCCGITFLLRSGVIGLLLCFRFDALLADVQALLVERKQIVRIGIAFGSGVLTQVEVLVDHFRVVRLMDQLARLANARSVGVLDLASLGALVNVLRMGSACSRQEQDGQGG